MTIDIARLREMDSVATTGPWRATRLHRGYVVRTADGRYVMEVMGNEDDVRVVVDARNVLPDLLNGIEYLRDVVDRMERQLRDAEMWLGLLVNATPEGEIRVDKIALDARLPVRIARFTDDFSHQEVFRVVR